MIKNNLLLRIVSILILAPVVLWAIITGGTPFAVLVSAMGALMAWEWERMITGQTGPVSIILASSAVMVGFLTKDTPSTAIQITLLTSLLVYIKSHKKLLLSFGTFYIDLTIFSVVYLTYYSGYEDQSYSYVFLLWVLFVVWATDIGGYIFGKSIGGPKLIPRISPNKTWAGLVGGIVMACLITYAFVLTRNHYYGDTLPMKFYLYATAILAFVAQVGDIFESAIKRYLNLKDSSNLIPGHGGIFDRIDGFIFAVGLVAFFLILDNMGYLEWLKEI